MIVCQEGEAEELLEEVGGGDFRFALLVAEAFGVAEHGLSEAGVLGDVLGQGLELGGGAPMFEGVEVAGPFGKLRASFGAGAGATTSPSTGPFGTAQGRLRAGAGHRWDSSFG